MVRSESASRPSEARTRLLKTASQVFYAEGIHSVGVDRIVAEAQVTRATFYRHFPSKETLVVAYLTEVDRAVRSQVDAAVAAKFRGNSGGGDASDDLVDAVFGLPNASSVVPITTLATTIVAAG